MFEQSNVCIYVRCKVREMRSKWGNFQVNDHSCGVIITAPSFVNQE